MIIVCCQLQRAEVTKLTTEGYKYDFIVKLTDGPLTSVKPSSVLTKHVNRSHVCCSPTLTTVCCTEYQIHLEGVQKTAAVRFNMSMTDLCLWTTSG